MIVESYPPGSGVTHDCTVIWRVLVPTNEVLIGLSLEGRNL